MYWGSLKWKNPQLYFHAEGDGAGDKGGGGGQQGGQQGGGAGNSIEIQVGGETKTFTPDQIAQAIEKSGNLEKTLEGMTGFQKVLTQYGIGADEYLRNSEAAFAIANDLIKRGIIDDQGNVLEKKGGQGGQGGDDDPNKKSFNFNSSGNSEVSKQLKVITETLSKITDRVDGIDKGQSQIYRRNIKRDVQATHPNLDDEDISKLLALSQHDRSKGFWDHAAAMSQEKSTKEKETKGGIVKEVITTLAKAGLLREGAMDLDKLDELDINKLNEQGPGGGAPAYEGKKFIFGSRRNRLKSAGVDTSQFSSPAEVMHETFSQRSLNSGKK